MNTPRSQNVLPTFRSAEGRAEENCRQDVGSTSRHERLHALLAAPKLDYHAFRAALNIKLPEFWGFEERRGHTRLQNKIIRRK